MTRFTMKILGALVAVGCGSSAMASPSHGYWTDYETQHQTSPEQTQAAAQPTPAQPAQPAQSAQSPEAWDDQSQVIPASAPQSQPVQPAQPSQGQAQPPRNPWDEDQEEDSAETFTWSAGQSHLGVMVIGLTPELRAHFGAPNDRGVMIAKVETSSAASRAGLQVGDVLVGVGRTQIRAGDDVIQALAAHGGGRISLTVIRQSQRIRVSAMVPGQQPQPQQPQPPQPQQPPPQQQQPQQQPPQQPGGAL